MRSREAFAKPEQAIIHVEISKKIHDEFKAKCREAGLTMRAALEQMLGKAEPIGVMQRLDSLERRVLRLEGHDE